ncbi:uncharacterized protein LOC134865642 [Eleginops maclovinus]|uniref:uncharacterized protein LOC134865642 n=1 Tax=Eleginops maclovinus TaxID=56733 RepID=UPI0030807501
MFLNYRRERNFHIHQRSTQTIIIIRDQHRPSSSSPEINTDHHHHQRSTQTIIIITRDQHRPSSSSPEINTDHHHHHQRSTQTIIIITRDQHRPSSSSPEINTDHHHLHQRSTQTIIIITFIIMLSLDYCLHSLLLVSILRGVSGEDLSPLQTEEFRSEGSTVTLSYRYSKTITANEYFYWYRQYPGEPPESILYISTTSTRLADSLKSDKRFSSKLSEGRNIDLQISSAAVTDSAVYYCAVQPTVTGNTNTLYKNTS